MKKYFLVLYLSLFLKVFLQGAEKTGTLTVQLSSNGSPDLEGQSLDKLQENTKQWVNEIQLLSLIHI